MARFFLFCFLLCITGPIFGQQALIHGKAPDYAGKELTFFTFREPVLHREIKIASTVVEPDGTFALSIPVSQPTEVYTGLGKYKGTIVLEPGADYTITLPPYTPLSATEAASPYFKPELFWLGINGVRKEDVNFQVRAFTSEYNREISAHLADLYQRKSTDTAKAIISRLEKSFPATGYSYLEILKSCSYAELEYATAQPKREEIIGKYLATKPVSLSHPAYQQLFRTLFSDYLSYKSMDILRKEDIRTALAGDFSGWVTQLKKKGFRQDIAELAAVKCFYDGHYSRNINKKLMLKGLNEALEQATFAGLKAILPSIIRSVTLLQEGAPVPALKLKNLKDEVVPLRSGGRYLYLVFFRSDSKESRTELDTLAVLEKKLKTILEVVPVSLDPQLSSASKLWTEKRYPWTLYAPADPEKAGNDFRLGTVPEFYLVSPDLKLILSPALSPTHNFEDLFLKIYRDGRYRK